MSEVATSLCDQCPGWCPDGGNVADGAHQDAGAHRRGAGPGAVADQTAALVA